MPLTNDRIRKLALANGFKLKHQPDGSEDLNPYVFNFARALVAEQTAQNDALWETLIKIADALDIDPEEARQEDGKPSDVFIRHIKSLENTIERLEEQVENLGAAGA
ncbi:hypothetical protein TW86_03725 [Halomonas sp. S2151]|uniref:hypothetical protein n=1 Tax=Halomonas sp. S2151 TaxID=579478 RepID=UPI0005FA9197|nr:hypothetical protein [Halomonas sp. S2151]KJZ17376.1 hypothetical protein TW86_03725 [Halomonas sp. S2151]